MRALSWAYLALAYAFVFLPVVVLVVFSPLLAVVAIAESRAREFKQLVDGLLTRGLRKLIGSDIPVPASAHPAIEFIGVWDTVDAYGLPMDELAILWDRFIYPLYFPDYTLSPIVKRACHAVSVDDERLTFHPVLWDEGPEPGLVAAGKVSPGRIEQVWFPGVHSDVGGGYSKDLLALVTLDWMISKVEADPDKPDL